MTKEEPLTGRLRSIALLVSCAALAVALAAPAQSATNPITTLPATSVGPSQARMNGQISPNGFALYWQFQYGRSTNYGRSTPPKLIAATTTVADVHFTLPGLSPGVTYHYRLAVLVLTGNKYSPAVPLFGSDVHFKTEVFGKDVLTSSRVPVTNGVASFRVKCASLFTCRGRLRARVLNSLGVTTLTCADLHFGVAHGRTKAVRAKMSLGCMSRLFSSPSRTLRISLALQNTSSQPDLNTKVTLFLK